ncbi:uncharacterized protein B0I36DRAFT_381378 [Microdochium trichocladiopsis]|uniref:NmrA-like domain-containing protein n=1 Tax=Microdochium trichocladiopsis TaxID=1682393 RepID=A0A9P8YCQ7_9PEZI|nr:uncharacterized protein B0I36DRAFT_381378 [Microdochium trichocladiopsis]KAH7038356.1 hypothetical protein B0I36DRAFT_381378 [Microdochium trichocladiopsis]
MPKKILTVIGATGSQGGSVVATLLNHPNYTLRAVTRNPQGDKARSLSAQGVEVVSANLDDVESLKAAFHGSHAIFGMTNFFESLIVTHFDIDKAARIEAQQARNLADAAAATPSLEHYVWATLPNAARNTDGQCDVPYFASKNAGGDDYMRANLPELWAKTTSVWVGWNAENMTWPHYTPNPIVTADGGESVVYYSNVPPSTRFPMLGSVASNFGLWVRAILEQPHKTLPGKAVAAMGEYMPLEDALTTYSNASARAYAGTAAGAEPKKPRTHIIQVSDATLAELWPVSGILIAKMHRYMAALDGRCFTSVHGDIEVLTRADLDGLEGLASTTNGLEKVAAATHK